MSKKQCWQKELTLEETREIYESYGKQDFPADERKPFSMIEQMWDRGCYRSYGFYETIEQEGQPEDVLRAYALMVEDHRKQMLLLDYFAACKETRGQGYGSVALQQLKEVCRGWKGIVIEVEDDEQPLPEMVMNQRKRRISFYQKSGCQMTSTRSYVFGVDYRIMVLPVEDEAAGMDMAEKVTSIYNCMHTDEMLQKHFKITAV